MKTKKSAAMVFFAGLALGVLSYAVFQPGVAHSGGNMLEQLKRFAEVMTDVSKLYVEDVDSQKLVDGAIQGMLETLDPHSVYIPAKQLQDVNEKFSGHFDGIGIEFVIQNKYPTVIAPIPNSPSDRLGLRSGDQIIEIEGKSAFGITETEVMNKLRGPRGSTVHVKIRRLGVREPLEFDITRDQISIYSLIAAFMLDKETGYVKLTRFSRTTADELARALEKLQAKGMQRLILDLRSNSGGFLDQAVAVANKFIPEGRKIVYTRGRIPQANEEFFASPDPDKTGVPLIVLINHGSASASEIVAGAMQDLDRGLVVGSRSFGKGLVQSQVSLKDGSAVRITIARYYTPSGRLIQRSYKNGRQAYYEQPWEDSDADSAAADSNKPKCYTSRGRVVYGGGGITPDVVVASPRITGFSVNLIRNRLFFEYASKFAAMHKNQFANAAEFARNFQTMDGMLQDFRQLIMKKKIEFSEKAWKKDETFIRDRIKSEIARSLWGTDGYYECEVHADKVVSTALEHFPQAVELAALAGGKKAIQK